MFVFSKPIRAALLVQCAMFAAAWALFPQMRDYPLCIPLLATLLITRTIVEGRRAIILNHTEVVYRPPFACPLRARIADIQSISRAKATVSFGLRLSRIPALLIRLRNGGNLVLPLDFKDRDEILRQIAAVTGTEING